MGKILAHSFTGQHFIAVTRTKAGLNFEAIFKSSMRKAWVYHGYRYAFGGLTTMFCHRTSVPEQYLDYFPHIEASHYNMININGPDKSTERLLSTVERNNRDDIIMQHMFWLEMLRHRTSYRPSTQEKIDEIEARYLLNAHGKVVLGIDPHFVELVKDNIPIDPDDARDASNLDKDEIKEEELVGVGVCPFCQT